MNLESLKQRWKEEDTKEHAVLFIEQQIADFKEEVLQEISRRFDAIQLPKNGEDGYTPVKNVDYFDGEKGASGSKACFNTKNLAGGDISFYFSGTTMVVENKLCL